VNATSGAVEARIVTPGDGFSDYTTDFGFLRIELGDYVWIDSDNDGAQDASEAARANVTVRLETPAGMLVASTTTDSDGLYLFTSNVHGVRANTDYVVVIDRTQPTLFGFNATRANAAGVNDTLDSDAVQLGNSERVGIAVRTGALGKNNFTLDFGFFHLLELGDFVWNDRNGDGVQNVGEPPLAGVVVELRTADRRARGDDADQRRRHLPVHARRHALVPDTEYVVAIPAAQTPLGGLTPTWSPPASGDGVDSNGVANSNGTVVVARVTTGAYGTIDRTVDFGFVGELAIGDFVWLDSQRQRHLRHHVGAAGGQRDAAAAQSGRHRARDDDDRRRRRVPLRQRAPAAAPVDRVHGRDADCARRSAAHAAQRRRQRRDSTRTPPTLAAWRRCRRRPASWAAANMTFDIGLTLQSNLGDRVWLDKDGDGVQTAGEPGIAGVTVHLLDVNGAIVASTVTDATGEYVFNSLANGFLANTSYTVVLPAQTALSPYLPTLPLAGGDRGADSNGAARGDAIVFTLITGPPGTDDRSVDFGFVEVFGLGDRVFVDDNRNGVQDAGENGLAGVVDRPVRARRRRNGDAARDDDDQQRRHLPVQLARAERRVQGEHRLRRAHVDVAGAAGALRVDGARPRRRRRRRQRRRAQRHVGSDRDGALAAVWRVNVTFDFGVVLETRLGNFVWDDKNGDGLQTAGEPGIAGVRVDLFNSTGQLIGRR
jgi:hypothetical protein